MLVTGGMPLLHEPSTSIQGESVAGRLFLNGVTRLERQAAIHSATQAVQDGGGWIEDVHFFSNVAVNLRCIVPTAGVERLAGALGSLPLGLTPDDMTALARAASRNPDGEELEFSLQITFVHDEPDLRRHVPSVPG
jgi:hypothetical protein